MKRSAKSTFDSNVWKDRGVLSSSKSSRMPASKIAVHHGERKTANDQIAIKAIVPTNLYERDAESEWAESFCGTFERSDVGRQGNCDLDVQPAVSRLIILQSLPLHALHLNDAFWQAVLLPRRQ